MQFVKLTLRDGEPIWINLALVACMKADSTGWTRLYTKEDADSHLYRHFAGVKEGPEEILSRARALYDPVRLTFRKQAKRKRKAS
jgi:ABC-type siderophore export system fused ATPase/permease subunit